MPENKFVGIWSLREEARKFWKYFISDELIYVPQVISGNSESPHVIAKKYLDGDCWLEMHLTCTEQDEREMHFNCIVELAHVTKPVVRGEVDSQAVGIHGDHSVFVQVPEFIQLPKGIIPKGVASAIRLKRIEDICHCGWKELSPFLVGGFAAGFRDGKLNTSLFLSRESAGHSVSQSPCKLVEGRPQAADEVSKQHRNNLRDVFDFYPVDVAKIGKICFLGDGIGFRFKPFINFGLKRIEMILRPINLHFYVEGCVA